MDKAVSPTLAEVRAFIADAFPQFITLLGLEVEEVSATYSRVRMPAQSAIIRAGGTVAGPTLMTLADIAAYIAVVGAIGCKAAAFTSSLHINFLRKAPPGDLVAHARLLKVGRSLAVGEVQIVSTTAEEAVIATATVTYSLPV